MAETRDPIPSRNGPRGQAREASERNHAYSGNRPSFLLYGAGSANPWDAHTMQCALAKDPRADHGLRFTKFFGRWAAEPSHEKGETGVALIKKVWEEKDVSNRRGDLDRWDHKRVPLPTDPLLDWLDPSPFYLGPPIAKPDDLAKLGARKKGACPTLLVGDAARLKEAGQRLKELAQARASFEAQNDACFDLELDSRLLTGIGLPHPTENGFLFHPTLGVPYLRGTALKQVARDRAKQSAVSDSRIEALFGAVEGDRPKGAGRLVFLDAIPLAPVTLTAEQITPHYGLYYAENPATILERKDLQRPADWYEPVPVTLLAVERRAISFRFGVVARAKDGTATEDLKDARLWLTDGLRENGIGAKTTLGFGRFVSPEERTTRVAAAEQRKKDREAERSAAARNTPAWYPRVGAIALFGGMPVRIAALNGQMATIAYLDEGGEDDVPADRLTPFHGPKG